MTTNNSSSSGGIGVFGLMGVMFIGLRIAGVISWPWVWVLAPFWIPLVLGVIFLLIFLVIAVIAEK
tara:strand:- start:33 stop:230 length:198 start_codon:yes stop_codon:yes gene_type:complete